MPLDEETDEGENVYHKKRGGEYQISELLSRQKRDQHCEKEDERKDGDYRGPLNESGRGRVDGNKASEVWLSGWFGLDNGIAGRVIRRRSRVR